MYIAWIVSGQGNENNEREMRVSGGMKLGDGGGTTKIPHMQIYAGVLCSILEFSYIYLTS